MLRNVLVGALVWMVTVATSLAQSASTGAIAGTVRDQTGAVVPKAEVTIRNVASNETRQVTTQPDGVFVFPLLSPGEFVVQVVMGGFATATRERVRVNVTETTTLSIELQLEGVAATVEGSVEGGRGDLGPRTGVMVTARRP